MTDAECEAEFRRYSDSGYKPNWKNGRAVLRLLDEARAENASNAADYTACNGAQMEVIEALEEEIALLRAPPEADVMEWATAALDPLWTHADGPSYPDALQTVGRALAAYGDQRDREARAAAIEETAQEALTRDDGVYDDVQRGMARLIAQSIRALAYAPPQSEGG